MRIMEEKKWPCKEEIIADQVIRVPTLDNICDGGVKDWIVSFPAPIYRHGFPLCSVS